MALVVTKPLTYGGALKIGAVATYEVAATLTNAQDINGYIKNDNSTLGHNIGWETSPNDTDWAGGSSVGQGLFTMVISAIGSDTSPSISTLNNHPLITDYFHSSHSNSDDGNGVGSNNFGTWDWSNMTLSIPNYDTISFTSYNSTYWAGATDSTHGLRTLDSSSSTWYLNGIQVGSQSGGSSGNESYVDWNSYSSLATYAANAGSKELLKDNISGNNDAYIAALIDTLSSSQVRNIYTTLKNNETIS